MKKMLSGCKFFVKGKALSYKTYGPISIPSADVVNICKHICLLDISSQLSSGKNYYTKLLYYYK